MRKKSTIKFTNGSEITTLESIDSTRSKRTEERLEYYRKNPWVLVELQGVKLSLWQRILLKYWYSKK
jgi:hypothetical protein